MALCVYNEFQGIRIVGKHIKSHQMTDDTTFFLKYEMQIKNYTLNAFFNA